jgi:excisionase family DNA binding protein
MLTVPQAAEQVGRDPETVRRWIRSGKLPSKKIGTRHFVNEMDIAALSEESDTLPLPVEWKLIDDGTPQLDWAKLARRSRQAP